MKYITFLRHAKSSHDDINLKDIDRPLNDRGKKVAPLMGEFLKTALKDVPKIDRVICSTAKRTKETARLFLSRLGGTADISYSSLLYLTGYEAYISLFKKVPDYYEHILFIGHNPDIQEAICTLLQSTHIDIQKKFPTCATATLKFKADIWSSIQEKQGECILFYTPKMLEKNR